MPTTRTARPVTTFLLAPRCPPTFRRRIVVNSWDELFGFMQTSPLVHRVQKRGHMLYVFDPAFLSMNTLLPDLTALMVSRCSGVIRNSYIDSMHHDGCMLILDAVLQEHGRHPEPQDIMGFCYVKLKSLGQFRVRASSHSPTALKPQPIQGVVVPPPTNKVIYVELICSEPNSGAAAVMLQHLESQNPAEYAGVALRGIDTAYTMSSKATTARATCVPSTRGAT